MKKAAFFACLCCTLFSCSNVEKKASEKLQVAREAFERGDYSEAKIQIDSIKILYPKAFETRREGIGLMRQVALGEQEKTLLYLDSMLQEKQKAVDAIKGNYVFEKDAEYQKTGNYLHPSQVIEKNLHRSYLRFQVRSKNPPWGIPFFGNGGSLTVVGGSKPPPRRQFRRNSCR